MKRFFSFFAVLILSCTFVFANVEMDMAFGYSPYYSSNVENQDSSCLQVYNNALSFDLGWGFYFGSPAKNFDMGLSLSTGFERFFKFDVFDSNGIKIGSADKLFGINYYISVAPAFRVNFSKMHSLVVNPGLSYFIGGNLVSPFQSFIIGTAFNLDVGYRFWFVNNENFHFGLSFGYNLKVPFLGWSVYSYNNLSSEKESFSGNTFGGTDNKISLGLVFNFGSRGIDRKSESTENKGTEI